MKPLVLVERAIRNLSKSRDIVLNPFGGSGSTLIACERPPARCGYSGGTATLDGDGRSYEEVVAGREVAAHWVEPAGGRRQATGDD
jgi:hypothetical protein